MSRAITIEKFSRYLGEQEQLTSEEMIAHARHLMAMHKEGLEFGECIFSNFVGIWALHSLLIN